MHGMSYRDASALFAEAGATGIRHRAARAVYERRRDAALIAQLLASAREIEANRRHAPVAAELRRMAGILGSYAAAFASTAA